VLVIYRYKSYIKLSVVIITDFLLFRNFAISLYGRLFTYLESKALSKASRKALSRALSGALSRAYKEL